MRILVSHTFAENENDLAQRLLKNLNKSSFLYLNGITLGENFLDKNRTCWCLWVLSLKFAWSWPAVTVSHPNPLCCSRFRMPLILCTPFGFFFHWRYIYIYIIYFFFITIQQACNKQCLNEFSDNFVTVSNSKASDTSAGSYALPVYSRKLYRERERESLWKNFILAGGHVRASAGALAVHTALILAGGHVRASAGALAVHTALILAGGHVREAPWT